MTTLDVDAITNSSDETLTESNSISERIIAVAGNQLKEELSTTVKGKYIQTHIWQLPELYDPNLIECRIGDVRVTRGYNLPAKYVLHTVAPAYKEKLKTAAENALHCCYRLAWLYVMLYMNRD